jgi:hypothetical protein
MPEDQMVMSSKHSHIDLEQIITGPIELNRQKRSSGSTSPAWCEYNALINLSVRVCGRMEFQPQREIDSVLIHAMTSFLTNEIRGRQKAPFLPTACYLRDDCVVYMKHEFLYAGAWTTAPIVEFWCIYYQTSVVETLAVIIRPRFRTRKLRSSCPILNIRGKCIGLHACMRVVTIHDFGHITLSLWRFVYMKH